MPIVKIILILLVITAISGLTFNIMTFDFGAMFGSLLNSLGTIIVTLLGLKILLSVFKWF